MFDRRTFLAGLAGAAWLPIAHVPWIPDDRDVAEMVDRHLDAWARPGGPTDRIAALRRVNPEYDLMARTFTALALADVGLGGDRRCRPVLDRIIDDTLAIDAARGQGHWLLGYARARPFRGSGRSLFVDGQIAAMLGARVWLGDGERHRPELERRVGLAISQIEASPKLLAESYPDEVWLFCNTLALAATRMAGARTDLSGRWVRAARQALTHPETGLLASSATWDGAPQDGPEGSSIFFAATCLKLVAPDLAEDQYARARDELGRSLCSFGWAREWPRSWRGAMDVDSGAVVPGLAASPSASGLALIAARAFGDTAWWRSLAASVGLAGPAVQAANLVGDAVLLAGHTHGPLWDEITRRRT